MKYRVCIKIKTFGPYSRTVDADCSDDAVDTVETVCSEKWGSDCFDGTTTVETLEEFEERKKGLPTMHDINEGHA